ncbi:MAG: cytidylate kinase-like family protein [Magnetococcus sp. XQGC-1]
MKEEQDRLAERVQRSSSGERFPVVTVSRSCASGGSKIAELLAQSLAVSCYGYTLLEGLGKQIAEDKYVHAWLDERLPSRSLFDWIHAISNDGVVTRVKLDWRLVKTILTIAEGGGVIIGHGAHLILDNNPQVFRVRIEGSLDLCAERMARAQNMEMDEARLLVVKVNKERDRYLESIHSMHPSKRNRTTYDLVLNSDGLDPHVAVEIIVYAMEKMGFYLPGSRSPQTL